jgi:glycine/D-amino acid oxidase-like deaminating enzyme
LSRASDARATQAAIGSDAYEASCLDERGGHLNPFAYTAGLARASAAAGAVIHTGSPVRAVTREGGRWHVETPHGALHAEIIIIGTNAYSDALWPGICESIVPMRGHALVTQPLSDNLRAGILPGGQPMTDTRHLFSGVRLLADGSLHLSSDGPAFGPEADAFRRKTATRLARLFPFLGAPEWREAWSGWVAMTRDQFPHVHELAPGAFAALGYSGRGLAAASLAGRDLATLASGGSQASTTFPISEMRPIPAHILAPALLGSVLWWYRLRDRMALRRV